MTVIDFDVDTIAFQGFKSHWGAEGYVFTKQTQTIDQSSKAAKMDASCMGARYTNSLPGMQDAESKFDGVHTDAQGYVGDVLRDWVGGSTPKRLWSAFESLNVLSPCTFQPCSFNEYSVKSTEKDATKFNAGLYARGAFNPGTILVSPKSNTQLIVTGNASDWDSTNFGGSTAFGGAAQMHIYDLAGGTTPGVTMLVQHSPDGATWTTLATFVVVTILTAATTFVQRVKIPSTTVIQAHVRASWTTTGTPTSCQGIVMVGRNVDPDA